MLPAASLYAVILLQIVLVVFRIVASVVHVTPAALQVGLIVLQVAQDDVHVRFGCGASYSRSVSLLPHPGDDDVQGVTVWLSRVPGDRSAVAVGSVAGACHPGSVSDHPLSVAGNTGCVTGDLVVRVVSSRQRFTSFVRRCR